MINGKIILSWAEQVKAYRDNEAKWDRIKQPVDAALHRWFVKEYQRGKARSLGQSLFSIFMHVVGVKKNEYD